MLALSEDTLMLAESAFNLFRTQDYPAVNRGQREWGRAATGFHPEHWRAAVDLGWTGVLVPDQLGGLGFPVQGIYGLFEAAGRSLAGLPLLTQLVLAPTLLCSAREEWTVRAQVIEELLSGDVYYGIAIDEGARHDPKQCQTLATPDGPGWRLSGVKRYALDVVHADWILVSARQPGDSCPSLFRVSKAQAGLAIEPCALLDLRSRGHVALNEVSVGEESLVLSGEDFSACMARALNLGRAALSAELVGLSQTVFDTTLEYLQQREQFDRKLGSFQALQHRMARLHAEIQLARAGVLGALEGIEASSPLQAGRAVAMAKFKAGEVADLATNEATQLHGGMGVTDELNIGLFLKRARVAENCLGDQTFQIAQLSETWEGRT